MGSSAVCAGASTFNISESDFSTRANPAAGRAISGTAFTNDDVTASYWGRLRRLRSCDVERSLPGVRLHCRGIAESRVGSRLIARQEVLFCLLSHWTAFHEYATMVH